MEKSKKILSLSLVISFVFLINTWSVKAENDKSIIVDYKDTEEAVLSASSDVLLSTKKITLHLDSTVDDIINVYGAEKLKTISRFDGYAYSFYNDNYSDYLYIETTSTGKIAMFAVFGEFESFAGNSGDKKNYITSDTMLYSDLDIDSTSATNNIWAAMAVCTKNLDDYDWVLADENYSGDVRYSEAVARHTAEMWNAINVYYGKSSKVEFDSKTFYINRQLMENESSLYNYCEAIGDGNYNLISIGPHMIRDWVNPLYYAFQARNYNLPDKSYIICDTYNGRETLGSLNKTFYQKNAINIPYTNDEIALINKMRNMYMSSVTQWNETDKYYLMEPQSSVLPLEIGKINPELVKAAVTFLNVIRVGAGLPELIYSEELSDDCQYKAVLTNYLSESNISNPNPHYPPQPDGISDEFYERAQSGNGENLYMGLHSILTSITNALDDSYGDPITCGHRYNLLNPYYQNVGLGGAEGQCVHKFDGHQSSDVDVVAWPSKGIMISEAGGDSGDMYTVKFYNSPYRPTSDSGVIFKCLNTGETFIFDSGMENTSAKGLYQDNDMVSYYDESISMTAGNVYEITVTDVKNDETGEVTNYTYRSVYIKLYGISGATALTLSSDSISLQQGETKKLSAEIEPKEIENKMITWTSNNSDVVSVNEGGYVTALSPGTAIITAKTDNGISVECTVTVQEIQNYDESEYINNPFEYSGGYAKIIELTIGNPIMTIDGSLKEIDPRRGTAPVIISDRTLLPVRAIVEAVGGNVEWDEHSRCVTLKYKDKQICLNIDSFAAYLNDKKVILDVAPTIINGRTMLPIRFIAEEFGFNVDWNMDTQMVTIAVP